MSAERGILYQKLRDYRKAVRELSKATALETSNPQVRAQDGPHHCADLFQQTSEPVCACATDATVVCGPDCTSGHVLSRGVSREQYWT